MPETSLLPVKLLSLDLSNYRTVKQKSEIQATHALFTIRPNHFEALMRSLMTHGYLPTDNIIVLKTGSDPVKYVIKEGNRRVAALKLLLGHLPDSDVPLPANIKDAMERLSAKWKADNAQVPCAIYEEAEKDTVDRIVNLTHGKGERAGRDKWNAVARARHNRDANKQPEPGLDLLEHSLRIGGNLTDDQRERWAGEYPLTVLDEVIKRISDRFGASSAPDLARKYPHINHRDALDKMIKDIGLKKLAFGDIRNKDEDFSNKYGLSPVASPPDPASPGPQSPNGPAAAGSTSPTLSNPPPSQPGTQPVTGSAPQQTGVGVAGAPPPNAATSTINPQTVMDMLNSFHPIGKGRSKVVLLLDEAKKLKIDKTPHAFCFVLRSLLELSAYAYMDDHPGEIQKTKKDGKEKNANELLKDIRSHLINKQTSQKEKEAMTKRLHGAKAVLEQTGNFLSVTSLNQLVHNPAFTITAYEIANGFGNIGYS